MQRFCQAAVAQQQHSPRVLVLYSFFSTKSEGMGLGLSIVRTLVEAHGGGITAENGAEEGAVFSVELPIGAAPAAKPGATT